MEQVLSWNDNEHLIICGYKKSFAKTCFTYSAYLLSLGIIRLVFHWFPTWRLYATHIKCSLEEAEKVLVIDDYNGKFKTYFVEDVRTLPQSNDGNLGRSEKAVDVGRGTFDVYLGDGYSKEMQQLRVVWCKKLCYVWDDQKRIFVKLSGLDKGKSCLEYHKFGGYSSEEQMKRMIVYGPNEIDIAVDTILKLVILEALTPFYIFQVFSLIVWFAENYYYYTIAIIATSLLGIISFVVQTRRNQRSLRESMHTTEPVMVSRGNGIYEQAASTTLVPGDVIEIPKHGCTMQCDAVLVNGGCIVNESMLTGESVPITKTTIPKLSAFYNAKEDGFYTLFCGTQVIQTRCQGDEKVLAVVIRTGFLTSKGELVRSILYPPPSDFKFDRDSYKYIGILTVIALMGFVYTVVSKIQRSIAVSDIIAKALDLITITIPPALPAAMTLGKLYALNRLKRSQIMCINSRAINVSGSIDFVCFDKTGTLTENGLDMWGVVLVEHGKLKEPVKNVRSLPTNSPLVKGMATCHTLNLIGDEFVGDPLDVKVFESTGWRLEKLQGRMLSTFSYNVVNDPSCNFKESNNKELVTDTSDYLEILQQYPFSSNLQRMSVVVKFLGSDALEVYCKGSPEMLLSLCTPETVPLNMQDKLGELTEKGYRVIALGTKTLSNVQINQLQYMERPAIESNLEFVGLIVLENKIKAQTPATIKLLKDANINVMMITGDNIQTAISVARECGIVNINKVIVGVGVTTNKEQPRLSFSVNDFFSMKDMKNGCSKVLSVAENGTSYIPCCYVMSGKTWDLINKHFSRYIPEFLRRGVVFARMASQQKQHLIQELQKLGYYVAMCGDGANDCGALKTAHVGISLSEGESSVASPFISKTMDISCVSKVITEGRAALITSFGVFKFMVCYSLTQLTSLIILYGIDCNLSSLQFLFIDLCIITHFILLFGKAKAYKGGLSKIKPPTSLLGLTSVMSLLFQMSLVIIFQTAAYKLIQAYDWFTPFQFDPIKLEKYISYENYAVFCMSMFQYIILAIAFSKGKPYRIPLYTNAIFSTSIVVMVIVCLYITLYPAHWIISVLELKMPPDLSVGLTIIGLAVVHFLCSIALEDIVVGELIDKQLKGKFGRLLKLQKNCDLNFYPSTSESDNPFDSFINESKLIFGKKHFSYQDAENNFEITKL